MPEYIERSRLLRDPYFQEDRYPESHLLRMAIMNQPAADVEPVRHGRWIEDGDYQICSNCGEEHAWDEYRASYCDVCGAKMDLEERSKT